MARAQGALGGRQRWRSGGEEARQQQQRSAVSRPLPSVLRLWAPTAAPLKQKTAGVVGLVSRGRRLKPPGQPKQRSGLRRSLFAPIPGNGAECLPRSLASKPSRSAGQGPALPGQRVGLPIRGTRNPKAQASPRRADRPGLFLQGFRWDGYSASCTVLLVDLASRGHGERCCPTSMTNSHRPARTTGATGT